MLWQGNLLAIINSSVVTVSPLHHFPPVDITSEFNKKYRSVSQDSVDFGLKSVVTSDSSINQEQD